MATRSARGTSLLLSVFSAIGAYVVLEAQSSALIGVSISHGYIPPTSKVGIHDYHFGLSDQLARYARFVSIGSKLKGYNSFWDTFEQSSVPSSTDPALVCPSGHTRVPASEAERVQKGYKKFRCFSVNQIATFDNVLALDQQNGIESAALLWASPSQYRETDCVGAPWEGAPLNIACVPRLDAMDDFEDYVNFLASRYNGLNGFGRFTHFVVWNEVQSGTWFNLSPIVPFSQVTLSPQQLAAILDRYETMLRRTHAAINRHVHPALMYVSLDPLVSESTSGPYHANTVAVMDGLWTRLGTSIDWSIAIHPYGEPTPSIPNWINYAALPQVVQYQSSQLAARGVLEPLRRPQSILFASEQGWPNSLGDTTRGVYMCQAHNLSMNVPTLIGSTHNHIQAVDATDVWGLLPASAGPNLVGIETIPTWLAYQSTSPTNWGRNNGHACCQYLGLGCVGSVIGTIDGVFADSGTYVLKGWACSENSNESISVHLYGLGAAGGGGVFMGGFNANVSSEPQVAAACRSSGKSLRFSIPLTPWLQYHGVPLYVHGISPYSAGNPLLGNSGVFAIP